MSSVDGSVAVPEPVHGDQHRHLHDGEHHDGHQHEHEHDDDGRQHPHDHDHGGGQAHSHDGAHDGGQEHSHTPVTTITLEQSLLARNDLSAARNRGWLAGRAIQAFNVMSSPGAGKTTLLVRTIEELGERLSIAVIEGDQETSLDADRIRRAGRPAVQINTGAGCHLDADMLRRGLDALNPDPGSTLFIENVGNLVCPALFDLGETAKVVIISVTEGDDKPQKYPHMFMAADLVIINKSDLLPYVEFDVDECFRQARQLNPHVEMLAISATGGAGLDSWYDWLIKNTQTPASHAGAQPHPMTSASQV
ncbi:hydrogenase nickel incorporation protein HypB [Arthrobacter terrae]|uniref:hydrogenase nickel incorporation protein HypB n=1 Tax=Arthrobacter terrae TaxID=2935737 RepID=UPI0028B25E91|nr:hydrogenase nickel incorporation protein HypB [Arthrobacter terrae]